MCQRVSHWKDFSEFVTAKFYQYLTRNSRFDDKRTITEGILGEDLRTFELLTEVGYNLWLKTVRMQPIVVFPWQHSTGL
jgi:hypothetical protein